MSFNMFLKQSDEWNFIMNHIDTVLIQIGIFIWFAIQIALSIVFPFCPHFWVTH